MIFDTTPIKVTLRDAARTHIRGDKEFADHGPEVWARANWSSDGAHVKLRLWMKAQET